MNFDGGQIMCECLKEVESQLVECGYKDASLVTAFVQVGNALKVRTYTDCSYSEETRTGKIKTKKIPVTHTYCPFCGKQYE